MYDMIKQYLSSTYDSLEDLTMIAKFREIESINDIFLNFSSL